MLAMPSPKPHAAICREKAGVAGSHFSVPFRGYLSMALRTCDLPGAAGPDQRPGRYLGKGRWMRSAGTPGPVVPESCSFRSLFQGGSALSGEPRTVAAVELEIRLGKLEVGCLRLAPWLPHKQEQWRLPRGESWQDCEMPHLCSSHCWPISVGRAPCTPGGDMVCE